MHTICFGCENKEKGFKLMNFIFYFLTGHKSHQEWKRIRNIINLVDDDCKKKKNAKK